VFVERFVAPEFTREGAEIRKTHIAELAVIRIANVPAEIAIDIELGWIGADAAVVFAILDTVSVGIPRSTSRTARNQLALAERFARTLGIGIAYTSSVPVQQPIAIVVVVVVALRVFQSRRWIGAAGIIGVIGKAISVVVDTVVAATRPGGWRE